MRGARSRILVTGSADGLGRAAAQALLAAGHDVVVHARNQERAAALGRFRRPRGTDRGGRPRRA
ncbi:SDR family NAD(P)-dependent oxidoreductase [Streptomyces collinus]|uniref:SDR family NAD(P)-dependent oxidoreductase n=1 Tax=Streptomyces collinus TaxID=42684 RepID=UPI003425D427